MYSDITNIVHIISQVSPSTINIARRCRHYRHHHHPTSLPPPAATTTLSLLLSLFLVLNVSLYICPYHHSLSLSHYTCHLHSLDKLYSSRRFQIWPLEVIH
ncbi:hypothetical protein Hanom_Chr16g01450661 [Helianthus anomalus]